MSVALAEEYEADGSVPMNGTALQSTLPEVCVEGAVAIQSYLLMKNPLAPGDPCPCNDMGGICEEPCSKVHSFMEANPNLGDKFQDV